MVALTSAMNHLEKSLQTLAKNGEKAFSNSFWLATAETEYALFLLSLTHQDESDNSSIKHGSTSKHPIKVKPALASAQDLLKSAKNSTEAGDFVRAYEETRMARNTLLRVEELLDQKRKGGGTKTTSAATQSP